MSFAASNQVNQPGKGDPFPQILKPTLLINRERAIRNIRQMAEKARASGVRFRPHFKTHQSAEVGEWFREFGVEQITVSSVDMARYFAAHGWRDITIAFPLNVREIEKINALAKEARLNLLVESRETARFLKEHAAAELNLWIKIDAGSRRSGIPWDRFVEIAALAAEIQTSPRLKLQGLLTHAGHTYRATSPGEIREIFREAALRMQAAREHLALQGFPRLEISVGDTPACSLVEDFKGVDEIRPGNFVYYDLMQLELGACREEEIAAAVACPVAAKHPGRGEIVLYGGAVHLSKDFILTKEGTKLFGRAALPRREGWGKFLENTFVAALSQEHGIVKTGQEFLSQIQVGSLLMVVPVHSCLAADLLKQDQVIV